MKRTIKANADLTVRDKVKYAVIDKINDGLDDVTDNLAIQIMSDIPEYNADWCADEANLTGSAFVKYNQAISTLANTITDILFANK